MDGFLACSQRLSVRDILGLDMLSTSLRCVWRKKKKTTFPPQNDSKHSVRMTRALAFLLFHSHCLLPRH